MRREMTALICLGFPIFYVFWIVFSGTFAVHELMIGAVGALLATSGMLVIGVQYPALFSPSACNLIAIWRIPWYVLSGISLPLREGLSSLLWMRYSLSGIHGHNVTTSSRPM